MTFFDFPGIPQGRKGTNSITKPSFRVPSDEALTYYMKFEAFGIKHDGIQNVLGKKVLPFQEEDGQDYQLVSDEGNSVSHQVNHGRMGRFQRIRQFMA